jgi:hypothetical protein
MTLMIERRAVIVKFQIYQQNEGKKESKLSGTGDKMRPLTWLTWSAMAAL